MQPCVSSVAHDQRMATAMCRAVQESELTADVFVHVRSGSSWVINVDKYERSSKRASSLSTLGAVFLGEHLTESSTCCDSNVSAKLSISLDCCCRVDLRKGVDDIRNEFKSQLQDKL